MCFRTLAGYAAALILCVPAFGYPPELAAVRDPLIAMISEITQVPASKIELEFDVGNPPTTLAAITTTSMQRALQVKDGKPVTGHKLRVIISTTLLDDYSPYDSRLKGVIAHEYFHNVLGNKIERKALNEMLSDSDFDPRAARVIQQAVQKFALPRLHEFYADSQAQRRLIEMGEYPFSMIELMDDFSKLDTKAPPSVVEYVQSSHPRSARRKDFLENDLQEMVDKGELPAREILINTAKSTQFVDFYREYRKTEAFKKGAIANYEEQLKSKAAEILKEIRGYRPDHSDSLKRPPYLESTEEELRKKLKRSVSAPNVEAPAEIEAALERQHIRFVPDVHSAHALLLKKLGRTEQTPEGLTALVGHYSDKLFGLPLGSPLSPKLETDRNAAYAALIDKTFGLLYTSELPLRERAALIHAFQSRFYRIDRNSDDKGAARAAFFAQIAEQLAQQSPDARANGLKNLADLFRFEETMPVEDYRKLVGHPVPNKLLGVSFSSDKERHVGSLAYDFHDELPVFLQPLKENPLAVADWISVLADHRKEAHSYLNKETRPLLVSALLALSPEQLESLPLEDVLIKAKLLKLDFKGHYAPLSKPVEARLKSQLDPGQYTKVAQAHPELAESVAKAATHHLETFRQQAKTAVGPDEWHTRFFSELLLGQNKLGDSVLFDTIEKEVTQKALARLANSLRGSPEEVVSRAAKALQGLERAHLQEWELNRPGPGYLNRLKRSALSKSLSTDAEAALEASIQLSFLTGEAEEQLNKALSPHKERFLLEVFKRSNPKEQASFGASPVSLKFLRSKLSDPALLESTLAMAVRERRDNFDFESFARVFDRPLEVGDFIDSPISIKDKMALLGRVAVIGENPRHGASLEKLLKRAEQDWLDGKMIFSDFLKTHSVILEHLLNPHAMQAKQGEMGLSLERALNLFVERTREKFPAKKDRVKKFRELVQWQENLPEEAKGRGAPTYLGSDGLEAALDETIVKAWRAEVKDDAVGLTDLHRSNLSYTGYSSFASLNQGDFIGELYESIFTAKLPPAQRLRMLAAIRKHLTPAGLEKAWQHFSNEMLYGKPYRPEVASDLLHRIYGDYYDGQNRKMNEVFDRFKLKPPQMASLKDSLTSGSKQVKSIVSADVLLAAIDHSVGTPRESIEFLAWLQGRTENAPATAERVLEQVAKLQQEAYEGRTLTKDELRDLYQNNHPAVRVAMVTPLVSPNDKRGLLATKEGQDLLVEFLVDGMDSKKAGDLRFLSEIYLEALGPEGHPVIARLVAAQGKAQTHTDAEKLSGFVQSRGALWVKMAQQGAADETLISDPELRDAFGLLKEWSNIPERPNIYEELERIMGDQYSQMESLEEVKGGGSINVAVLIKLKNGKRYIARYVRNNPGISVDYELTTMLRFAKLLQEKALASDEPAFRGKWLRMARFLQEYLPTLAAKIRDESKLSRDKRLAEMLRPSYNKDYKDLGVKVRLIEPEEPVAFKSELNPKAADPERLVLTSFLEVTPESELSDLENERFHKGIFRAELEAIFQTGKFDPDGHEKNYLKLKSPENPKDLQLFRFDISQAEEIDPETREAFRKSIAYLIQKRNRPLAWFSSISDTDAYRSFLQLTTSAKDSADFRKHYDTALAEALNDASIKDPLSLLREVKFRLENSTGGNAISFKPSVHLAIKSLHLIQQPIDFKKPANQGFLAEELVRVVGQKPAALSKVVGAGMRLWQTYFNKPKAPTAAQASTERADFNQKWVLQLEKDGITVKTLGSLEEMIERSPSLRERIFSLVHAKLRKMEENAYDKSQSNDAQMYFGFLKKHDPHYLQTIVADIKKGALEIQRRQAHFDSRRMGRQHVFVPRLSHALALQEIAAQRSPALTQEVASVFVLAPELGSLLSDSTLSTEAFRTSFETELSKRLGSLTLDHLVQLDPKLYPKVHAKAAEVIAQGFSPKSGYSYFADGHYRSAKGSRHYEEVAKQIVEGARNEDRSNWEMHGVSLARFERSERFNEGESQRESAAHYSELLEFLVDDAGRTGSPAAAEAYRLFHRSALSTSWQESQLEKMRVKLRAALPTLRLSPSQWVALLNDPSDKFSDAVAEELNHRGMVDVLAKSTRPAQRTPQPKPASSDTSPTTADLGTHLLLKTPSGFRLVSKADAKDKLDLPASNRLAEWHFNLANQDKAAPEGDSGEPILKMDPVKALKKSATAGGLASIAIDYYWNSFRFPFAREHYTADDLKSLIRFYESKAFSTGAARESAYRGGAAIEFVSSIVLGERYDEKDYELVLKLLTKLPRGIAVQLVSSGGRAVDSSDAIDRLKGEVVQRHARQSPVFKALLQEIAEKGHLEKALAEKLRGHPIGFTELAELESFLKELYSPEDRRNSQRREGTFPLLEVVHHLQYASEDVKATAEGFLSEPNRGSPIATLPSSSFTHLKSAFRGCQEAMSFLAPPVGLTHFR